MSILMASVKLSGKYLFFGKSIKSLNLNIKTMEIPLFFAIMTL